MRRLRYQVATSLDGFIAGPKGEYDWITMDPDIDFDAIYRQFDTVVMGRKSFMLASKHGGGSMPGFDVIVFSRTLKQADYPKVSIVNSDPGEYIRAVKAKPGKDIWLWGGGEMFHTLLAAGVVDTVEPAVMPTILGEGIPMLPPPMLKTDLSLTKHRLYPKSGIMFLEYAVGRRPRSKRGADRKKARKQRKRA